MKMREKWDKDRWKIQILTFTRARKSIGVKNLLQVPPTYIAVLAVFILLG